MATLRLGKSGFRFNALHSFPNDSGYDRQPHGHDYEFTVMIEGTRQQGEMVFDLRELKPLVENEVIAPLDHQSLDPILADSSLEALAEWIWTRLRVHIPPGLRLGLMLWETRSLYIEYWGD